MVFGIKPAIYGWILLIYVSFVLPILFIISLSDRDKIISSPLYFFAIILYYISITFLVRDKIWAKWLTIIVSIIVMYFSFQDYFRYVEVYTFYYGHNNSVKTLLIFPILTLIILITSLFINKDLGGNQKIQQKNTWFLSDIIRQGESPIITSLIIFLPIDMLILLVIFPFIGFSIFTLISLVLLLISNLGIIWFFNFTGNTKKFLLKSHNENDFKQTLKIMVPIIGVIFLLFIIGSLIGLGQGGDAAIGAIFMFWLLLIWGFFSLIILAISYILVRPYK